MALFTAAAVATVTAIKALTLKAVLTSAAKFVLTLGVSRLLAKRSMRKALSGRDAGGRIQLGPATDNKIPVVYGSAFLGGPIIDAKISTDQKTMWYVVALAEHTDTTAGSGYTFGDIYYEGKLVNFGTNGAVSGLVNNNQGVAEVDTKINGNLFIYLFTNGVSSGVNTGGLTATQILSDAAIPVGQRWTSAQTMTNCAFAIVQVIYNTDAGTTSLGVLTAQVINSLNKPGQVLKDYMINTRYGCAIPVDRIDLTSLTSLDAYSDATITYVPVGGGSTTQPRYRINGPIDTGDNCLNNLQVIVDSCDSWLQYNELTAKWKVVINQSYLDYTTFNDLFVVDTSNLVTGIQINPIDLNQTYNELEVGYPNKNIKDQADYQTLVLSDYLPGLLSPNEAVNRLNIDLPIVNEVVQAKYVGLRRLLQSREDLIINFSLDYSGIQVEAGDVIRVNSVVYGWVDKLFRVMTVAEQNYGDGTLGASIQAFEYNDTVYADNSIQDFVPAFNTGLTDPNIISLPIPPVLTTNPPAAGEIQSINVKGTVPSSGTVLFMDFNYGTTSNVSDHILYRTISKSDGTPFVANEIVQFDVNDAGAGTYFTSVTARNDRVGRASNASDAFVWGGMNLTEAVSFSGCNANSSGTLVTLNSIPNLSQSVGGIVTIDSGTGTLVPGTIVANVISNTQFNLSTVPSVALSNACVSISAGGITGNNIQANTVTVINLVSSSTTQSLGGYQWTVAVGLFPFGTLTPPVDISLQGPISTAVFENKPLFINDEYSGGGGFYPFFEGNSALADFYQDASTGPLEPQGSDMLFLENGDLNWWVCAYKLASETVTLPGLALGVDYNTQIVSDDDVLVQFIPFVTVNTLGVDQFLADTELMSSYTLLQNIPVRVDIRSDYTSTDLMTGGGVVMRIYSLGGPSPEVTMVNGAFSLRKIKL